MSETLTSHYRVAVKVASRRLMIMFLVSGFAASHLILGVEAFKVWRSYQPLSDWFTIFELYVPTPQPADPELFSEPDNARPYVFFGRDIKRYFDVQYSVSVTRMQQGDTAICGTSGYYSYRPRAYQGLKIWSIDKFLGGHCHLDPGKYRIEVTWKVLRDGYYPDHARFQSNVFEIIPSN